MNLKRGVGIGHYYKKYGNTVENMHLPALANLFTYLMVSYHHKGTTQMLVKSTAFFSYTLAYISIYFPAKVGIKCCRFYGDLCCIQLR